MYEINTYAILVTIYDGVISCIPKPNLILKIRHGVILHTFIMESVIVKKLKI